ncbi:glycosyl hydrolase 115 family protein [Steroidobacter flavus]|uniref:Glycosyl hydrolase 115 family protein n=1 Tax=Steroidobacter flavus TaxID=1842136 RepID=A0ABV8SXP4_9GAMM
MAFVRILAALSFATLVLTVTPEQAVAQQASTPAKTFDLVADGVAPTIFTSPNDAPVVAIAAQAFAGDVERVSGIRPKVSQGTPEGKLAILAGTIGGSTLIDQLIANKRIAVDKVIGQTEAYTIAWVENPAAGVARALVVAGADRRGTAYGIFRLSEQIGVSPWVWWADAAPTRRSRLNLGTETIVQGSPSVRYRGIFINDEDWSLRPWAAKNDPSGDIGPQTYAKVFELLLRLRANFLWPAMHKVTAAFNQVPGNAEMADRYAIVMGASHAEPMLRDNVAEWNFDARGEYNYHQNGPQVLDYWRERVKLNHQYENVYTVGMRGIHDSAVEAGRGVDGVKLLEQVVADQRGLFREVGQDPASVPQVFVPYKEVLDVYRKGMKVPEDVTLGWVDDNYGYIRQLSTTAEQKRSGGAGVYYHISYWGVPNDYLWLDTTPPALIAEEMGKAWATHARRLWVLNVGDIKPGERGMNYFLDLAYDYEGTAKLGQRGWLKHWAAETFAPEQADAIAALLDDYYRLNFARKPEHMGFNDGETTPRTTPFSPVAYGDEAGRRIAEFRALDTRAEKIAAALPADKRDGFYHLVQYPVRGTALTNIKILSADRSFLYAHQGRASANAHAQVALEAFQRIKQATEAYNAIGDGKWARFMDDAPRNQSVFYMPPVGRVTPSATPSLGVAVEGSVDSLVVRPAKADQPIDYALRAKRWQNNRAPDQLPTFERATDVRHYIDAFNTGAGTLDIDAKVSAPWIRIERELQAGDDQRLWVSIDWSKLKSNQTASGTVTVSAAGESRAVKVEARNVSAPAGALVEDNGIVAFSAGRYTTLRAVNGSGWQRAPELGRSGNSLMSSVGLSSVTDAAKAPYAEYRFRTTSTGEASLHVTLLPSFALNREHKLRYAVSINDGPVQVVDAEAKRDWSDGVQRNAMTTITEWPIAKSGEQRLKVYAMDPGVVVDSFVVDFGGLAKAYLAPPETIAK